MVFVLKQLRTVLLYACVCAYILCGRAILDTEFLKHARSSAAASAAAAAAAAAVQHQWTSHRLMYTETPVSPPCQLATPPGCQANHIPKGKLVPGMYVFVQPDPGLKIPPFISTQQTPDWALVRVWRVRPILSVVVLVDWRSNFQFLMFRSSIHLLFLPIFDPRVFFFSFFPRALSTPDTTTAIILLMNWGQSTLTQSSGPSHLSHESHEV